MATPSETTDIIDITSSCGSDRRRSSNRDETISTVDSSGPRRPLIRTLDGKVFAILYPDSQTIEEGLCNNGDNEMMQRYLQDSVQYQEEVESCTEAYQHDHFLFVSSCNEDPVIVPHADAGSSEELTAYQNYIGHEVGVSENLSRRMNIDDIEDFNSSDSFASTESIIPKNIMCPKCPKRFMFKADLKRHDRYKHMKIIEHWFCKYCKKGFESEDMLKLHEPVHTKQVRRKKGSEYRCHLCKRIYKNPGSYSMHLRRCCHRLTK